MEIRPSQIQLGANKPFFLDKNNSLWVVASGDVEIYYVKRDQEGNLKSARNYLYTAKKGDILFSLQTGNEFNEFSLIAVSPKSKLIEVNKSYIGNLNKEQLEAKIERWVYSLSESIHQKNKPKIYTDINSEGILSLKKGEIAYPSKGLFWAHINNCLLYTSDAADE